MRLVNALGVDTKHGYRTLELFEGDITALESKSDVLVVSAFAGSYLPTRGTVVRALHERGVDLGAHLRHPELDLRAALGTWVTKPLPDDLPFRRVLCVEMIGAALNIEDALENVFASLLVLQVKGIETGAIAMPLLGTGAQQFVPDNVAQSLIKHAREYLQRSPDTSRLLFVEIDGAKAQVISDGMDRVLGRSRVTLPQERLVEALKRDVEHRIHLANGLFATAGDHRAEWLRLLQAADVRAFEFGIMGRKLVELILTHREVGPGVLAKRIRDFEQSGTVAPWICGYMNVLRHLGNESAHDTESTAGRLPPVVAPQDMVTGLFCVLRLLEFWIDFQQGRQDS